jgi:hypothetical protein
VSKSEITLPGIFLQTQPQAVYKLLPILFCFFLISTVSFAQNVPDSSTQNKDTAQKDTTVIKPSYPVAKQDTTIKKQKKKLDTLAQVRPGPILTEAIDTQVSFPDASAVRERFQEILHKDSYFNFSGQPVRNNAEIKKPQGKEGIFYFMAGLLVYFGLIRLFFGRYLNDILSLFFRATMKQQQIRDQLLQAPIPSLVLNFLYIITCSTFLTFAALHYHFTRISNCWLLLAYCTGGLSVIYFIKFIALRVTGWIFNVGHATDIYIFIVFMVNKVIGILLLPMLVLLAFTEPPLYTIAMNLSFAMLIIFLGYRFIISYRPIRNEIKVNRFHFFLYLCAFEIAPLLLIYKVLLIFVKSY